ncbi:hypothetical protein DV736_g6704, partial [Chaetothyriales sp. CBS 134916]
GGWPDALIGGIEKRVRLHPAFPRDFAFSCTTVSHFGVDETQQLTHKTSLLLDPGKAKVNTKDNRVGRTPLSWAAQRGNEAVVNQLLDTGKVKINVKDNNGRTPLLYAADNEHEAVVELLESVK